MRFGGVIVRDLGMLRRLLGFPLFMCCCGTSMRLRRIIVMAGGFVVVVFGHCFS